VGSANDDGTARGKLGTALRALRAAAGLRQVDAAADVGITQAMLSRAERGDAILTADVIVRLVRLYGADSTEAARLVDAGEEIEAARVDERIVFQSGATVAMQRRWARLEGEATHVRGYQPVMVIGVLQTAAYAASVFGTDENDPVVAQRMGRQQRLLAERGRRWTLVQSEGALRWQARSPQVMAEQVEHLIDLSRAPNVELGIVDWRTPVEVFPSTGFHLYDEDAAVVGIRNAVALVDDPRRLADYHSLFDAIVAVATFGDGARAALQRIADDYRAIT
jgi:transcriptional regulator with XRE-family HTH domain